MVFKLTGAAHVSAIGLKGAQLFDPSKKNRPMNEWVEVPFVSKSKWPVFAIAAAEYVSGK